MILFTSKHSCRNIFIAAALATFSACDSLGAAKRAKPVARSKEVLIRYTEERLNDALFVHRVDVVNGVRKERWAKDGVFVSEADWEEALLEAEKVERRTERRRAESLRVKEEMEIAQQQEFVGKLRAGIERKRLNLLLAQIDTELVRVKDTKIIPYHVFRDTTFATNKSFVQFCDELVPQARALCELDDASESDLSAMIAQLEPAPTQLRLFLRATIDNAINKCDDTRLLKELLESVA